MALLRKLVLDPPAAALSWLGRQGTRAVAASVIIGIAMPSIGAQLKPWVTEAVFVLLCIAFLRVDGAAFRTHLKRPALALTATAWTSLAIPIVLGVSYLAFGVEARSPDLFLGLMLQAIASPMMAAPALAALMGLDATLVLVTLLASTALIPLTAAGFSYAFIGGALTLSPVTLGLDLLAILAGAALIGLILRRIAGPSAIERQKDGIDGLNILVLFIFVVAVMENVGAAFLAAPLFTIGLIALAFIVFLVLLCMTCIIFAAAGRRRALSLGFMASQRNMGLMLAATGGALPDGTWLYFALAQFPIYLSPLLLKQLTRRVLASADTSLKPPTVESDESEPHD